MCSRLWNVTLIAIKYGFNRQKYWFETQLKTPHQDVCCFFKCHVYPSFFLDLDDLLKMRSTHHETELEGQWLVIAQRQHHMPIQTQDDEDASTSEPSGPMMQTQRMQPWIISPWPMVKPVPVPKRPCSSFVGLLLSLFEGNTLLGNGRVFATSTTNHFAALKG